MSVCPVRALQCYTERTNAFRQSYQLFVCFGTQAKGRALFKPGLSRWIVEAVELSYMRLYLDPNEGCMLTPLWGSLLPGPF